jgi:hypothetical protein
MLSAMDQAKIVFLTKGEQPDEDPRFLIDCSGRGLPGIRYDGSGITLHRSGLPSKSDLEKYAELAGLLGHASLFVRGHADA